MWSFTVLLCVGAAQQNVKRLGTKIASGGKDDGGGWVSEVGLWLRAVLGRQEKDAHPGHAFCLLEAPLPPPTRMCSCLPHVAGRSKKIVSQNKKGGLGKAAKAAFLGK